VLSSCVLNETKGLRERLYPSSTLGLAKHSVSINRWTQAVTFWGPVVVIIRRSFCGKQQFLGNPVVLIQLCISLRSAAPLRLLRFTYIFPAETQRNAEIRENSPLLFRPIIGRVLAKNIAAELNPFRSNVVENDILMDEDAVGNGEIGVQVNIICIAQLSWHLHRLTVNLFPYSPRVLCFFAPAGKLTKPG